MDLMVLNPSGPCFGEITRLELAHLAEGSEITGGRVDVYAGNLETQINWAGGVAKSKAIGAGIAVAVVGLVPISAHQAVPPGMVETEIAVRFVTMP